MAKKGFGIGKIKKLTGASSAQRKLSRASGVKLSKMGCMVPLAFFMALGLLGAIGCNKVAEGQRKAEPASTRPATPEAENLVKLAEAYKADEKKADADFAGTSQTIEGTVTETFPTEGKSSFPWLVLDGKASCLFDEGAELPAQKGERIRVKGKVLCREITGRVKLVDCAILK